MSSPEKEPLFGQLLYGTLDLEVPGGWKRLQAVLVIPDHGPLRPAVGHEVRCLEVSACDEAGVLLHLSVDEEADFGRLFVDAYNRRRDRAAI